MSETTPAIDQEEFSDDDLIKQTQGIRRKLMDDMVREGMPTDKDSIQMLLEVMKDTDRTALGNKRIVTADKNASQDREVQRATVEVIKGLNNRDPFRREPKPEEERFDDEQLPDIEVKPGETAIGMQDERHGDFMRRMDELKGDEDDED